MNCNLCSKPLKTGSKYCSMSCRNKAYVIAGAKKHITKTCLMCFKKFSLRPSEAKKRTLCSRECSNKNVSINMKKHRVKKITVECAQCLKKITRNPSKINKTNYCSKSCSCSHKQEKLKEHKIWFYQRRNGEVIRVRSSWEAAFIHDYLDLKNFNWKYEPKRFKLKNGSTYIPDFYVKENNCWYEIKGYEFRENSVDKALMFGRETGNNIKIIKQDQLPFYGVNLNQKYIYSIVRRINNFKEASTT